MMWTIAQVALGGALGATARFGTQSAALRLLGPGAAPWGTLAVNVVGSFAIGFFLVWLGEKGLLRLAPFLVAGFLGAFTTFSTFSFDTLVLWERGMPGYAAAYVAGSVIASLLAVVAGVALARAVVA